MTHAPLPPAPLWVRAAAAIVARLPAGRYVAMNRLSRHAPPPFVMRLPRALGGYSYACDLRDVVSREVCFTGRYEVQETALLQAVLRLGMTFVDVGANWGYYTLVAAHLVGGGGKVLSLEPDPRLFRKLHDVVVDNRLGQVTTMQVAAAEHGGSLNMAGYDEGGENFGLSRVVGGGVGRAVAGSGSAGEDDTSFMVVGRPLDDILDDMHLDTIDLLKMDIEGFEGAALHGLEKSLRDLRLDRLLLELHPHQLLDHGHSARGIVAYLRGFGYVPWHIDHSRRATREATYGRTAVQRFLKCLDEDAAFDDWPHLLWLKPGVSAGDRVD